MVHNSSRYALNFLFSPCSAGRMVNLWNLGDISCEVYNVMLIKSFSLSQNCLINICVFLVAQKYSCTTRCWKGVGAIWTCWKGTLGVISCDLCWLAFMRSANCFKFGLFQGWNNPLMLAELLQCWLILVLLLILAYWGFWHCQFISSWALVLNLQWSFFSESFFPYIL